MRRKWLQVVPVHLDLAKRCGAVLRGWKGVRAGKNVNGGEENLAAARLTRGEVRLESDDAGAVLEEGGREVAPGARAELLRGFSGAVAWPGCWTAAARYSAPGRAAWRRLLGFARRLWGKIGSQGTGRHL